jgi:hypothetical protein
MIRKRATGYNPKKYLHPTAYLSQSQFILTRLWIFPWKRVLFDHILTWDTKSSALLPVAASGFEPPLIAARLQPTVSNHTHLQGMFMKSSHSTNFEDIIQVIVGASALSVPVAFSEEAWDLGRTLPISNILFLVVISLLFINLYSIHNIFQGEVRHRVIPYILRTGIDYTVTVFVVCVVLLALDHLPLLTEPLIAVKRIIILSFPASMGAVVVDSFDKE